MSGANPCMLGWELDIVEHLPGTKALEETRRQDCCRRCHFAGVGVEVDALQQNPLVVNPANGKATCSATISREHPVRWCTQDMPQPDAVAYLHGRRR